MIYGILFAGGKGSRLSPITDSIPKPLVVIKNKTLLERNLDNIYHIVDEYIIVVSYLGEKIIESIGDFYREKPVTFVFQKNPKGGTLDALRSGLSKVKKDNSNFLVMNSDDIHGQYLFESMSIHIKSMPDIPAIGAHIYPIKERLNQFGIVKKTNKNIFNGLIEKPQEYISDLVNIGVYYLPNFILSLIDPYKENLSDKEEYITDFINLINQNKSINVIESPDIWIPISYPRDIDDANKNSSII